MKRLLLGLLVLLTLFAANSVVAQATEQMDNAISHAMLNSNEIDKLTEVLKMLYNGASYSSIINKQSFGFRESNVGILFTLIAAAGNYSLQPRVINDNPKKDVIKHAIDTLASYKNNAKKSLQKPPFIQQKQK